MKLRLPPRFGSNVMAGLALAAALALSAASAGAQDSTGQHWIGTWGAGPGGPPLPGKALAFTDQTLRLFVHTSAGGGRVRIRLSNEFGSAPLRIGAAHVALRAAGTPNGAAIAAGSDRVLTFGGKPGIVIPPGAPALSDPVDLDVPALSDLAVSLYLPGMSEATTLHGTASQTGYVSLSGDFTAASTFPTQRTLLAWPFLSEVAVQAPNSATAAIVTLGDSITDGARSTPDTNNRWPDWLARRLQASRDPAAGPNARPGVVNRGINANRLLSDPAPGSLAGRNIAARFDRDVLATPGVRWLILLIGINDIGNSSATNPLSADDVIAAYRQVIARAHASGIAAYGATLTPFDGARYYSVDKEAVRQAVNDWIRIGAAFDAVIDFDRATRDPVQPGRMLPAYDSGDHLHPNDAGYQAMGNAVPLDLFRNVERATLKATPPAAKPATTTAPALLH